MFYLKNILSAYVDFYKSNNYAVGIVDYIAAILFMIFWSHFMVFSSIFLGEFFAHDIWIYLFDYLISQFNFNVSAYCKSEFFNNRCSMVVGFIAMQCGAVFIGGVCIVRSFNYKKTTKVNKKLYIVFRLVNSIFNFKNKNVICVVFIQSLFITLFNLYVLGLSFFPYIGGYIDVHLSVYSALTFVSILVLMKSVQYVVDILNFRYFLILFKRIS